MKRQTKQKRILILGVAAVLILAAGIGIYTQYAKEISNKNMADSANVPEDKNQGYGDEITPAKTKFTEEEKERIESQTGVTVTEEGTVQVDIGAVQAEEESMPISREEAEELVIKELGSGSEIESMSVREEQDKHYWAARAIKGGEVHQVWIDAETGETFINQKE